MKQINNIIFPFEYYILCCKHFAYKRSCIAFDLLDALIVTNFYRMNKFLHA